jgi:beta-glucosidase-like glycosyl hydrolase
MCASRPSPPSPTTLTLDDKIGQLFVVGAHGTFMAESSAQYGELRHQVRDNRVGGVIWFMSNVYETAHVTRRLQAEARVPLLVSADLEAGMGMRFLDTTFWPSAMAVAATGDPSLAEAEGRVVAREAKAVGVNHIFAPVADVNVDPDNPVINTRSYGEDPRDVGRYVAALVRGIQSEGVLATAKHFPGHGDTHVDSHRSLPELAATRERLDAVELVPFREAIAAGVRSVMIGHLGVPSLDEAPAPVRAFGSGENPYGTTAAEVPHNGTMPATTSAKMVTSLLRHDLGFHGLVVTDAMDMGGITEHFDAGEAAVRALEAGQDQILMSPNTGVAIAAVKAAVTSGRLTEARIDESVQRILGAKSFVSTATVSDDAIFTTVDSEEHRQLAASIAQRALTLVRARPGVLPLARDARVAVITVSEYAETLNPMAELERQLTARLTNKPFAALIEARTSAEDVATIAAAAEKADVVVFALAVRARSGAGTLALPERARTLVTDLAGRKNVVAIAFGTPYLLREVPSLPTYFCAYGIQPVMQTAAAQALFGEAHVSGKLPVTIPGLYPRGSGIER